MTGKNIFYFNVLEAKWLNSMLLPAGPQIGDVDEETIKYEYDSNMCLGLKYLAFKPANKERLVFKTPIESCLTLYCNKRFKEMVCSLELTGL